MSLPSITRSAGGWPPANFTRVGSTSISLITASQEAPGAILPGHQAMVGSRTPPSQVEVLPPRKGPATPPFGPSLRHGPLSLVKSTRVRASSFSARSVSSTRPVLQSTSSTQSP